MGQKEVVIYVYALDINPTIQIPTTKYKVYDGYNAQATLRTTIMHRLCRSHTVSYHRAQTQNYVFTQKRRVMVLKVGTNV